MTARSLYGKNRSDARIPPRRLPARLLAVSVTFLLVFNVWGSEPAHAQEEGLVLTGEAGLDGYCKEGAWMPVRVTVENDGEDIDGVLSASTASSAQIWEFNVEAEIPSVSRKEWTLYVFPLGSENSIRIAVTSGDRTLAELDLPVDCVDPGDDLMGVWAANPSIFNTQTVIRTSSNRPVLVRVEGEDIPDRPLGLSMLSSLTISDVDTGALTDAQRASLSAWVSSGGRLIVAGGPGWQKTGAGLGSLLPLTPVGTQTLPDLEAIAAFVQSGDPLVGTVVAATGAVHPDAVVRISQAGLPLVVILPHGYGEIIYLAVDPALEPLRTWIGMEDLYRYLLGRPADVPTWRDGFKAWGEADTALNAIPGLDIPSAFLICGFIVFYIIVVGPVNFVVLRTLKKRELAWVSVPIFVFCFSGAIFLFGTGLIGSRPVVNRLSIVQIWPGEAQSRVDALVGIFSPDRDTYSLEVDSSFTAHPVPEFGFAADPETRAVFQTDSGFRAPEIRVDTGGLEGYAIGGQIAAPEFTHDLAVRWLSGGDRQLHGQVTNASGLSLSDAVILTSVSAIDLGDFGPGDSAAVSVILGGSGAVPLGTPPAVTGPALTDDTLLAIFGTNYMYPSSFIDLEDLRRFNLLSAALGGLIGGRGGGVYLLGWTDEAPFDTDLGGGQEQNTDSTLYIVHLRTQLETPAETTEIFRITPDQFYWTEHGEATGSNLPAPYESFIRSGSFALSFIPIDAIAFREVAGLTLHMASYGAAGQILFQVDLWDFVQGLWIEQESVVWGDNEIPSPTSYVGPAGEIRVRFSYFGTNRNEIEWADLTLEVLP